MLTALMFSILFLAPGQASLAPPLTIQSVSPRDHQTAGCTVVLVNTYTRPAVAWVIEATPYHDTGISTDAILAPTARLLPQATTVESFSCELGELPALEVVAVVYDNNQTYGNASVISQKLIRARLSLAAGLDELSNLLRVARPTKAEVGLTPVEQIASLVSRSGGAVITQRVRSEALTVLSRVAPHGQEAAQVTFDSLIQLLRTELQRSIATLRALTIEVDR